MRAKNKLVYGVGVNDADYSVRPRVKGRQVCPFYQVWASMLCRCYDRKSLARKPSYIGCLVCDDWLVFSNFKGWMARQDWQGKQLDKDLLSNGSKIYCPNVCVFIDAITNKFVLDCASSKGEWPIGVCFNKEKGKFQADCSNPFTKKGEYLGRFTTPNEAHEAWRRRKHELACQLAELQSDPRVAHALRNRYANPL